MKSWIVKFPNVLFAGGWNCLSVLAKVCQRSHQEGNVQGNWSEKSREIVWKVQSGNQCESCLSKTIAAEMLYETLSTVIYG